MPKNMPEVEVDNSISAPQKFQSVRHARRRMDGVRGVEIKAGPDDYQSTTFMDYTEAVRLHDALGAALAFLDDDGE